MNFKIAKQVITAAMLCGSLQANASAINDAAGDFINGYTGNQAGALDVISALVTYNPNTDIFHFESILNGPVTGSGAAYIWGLNRGAGTGRFAANGLPNVLFDSIVRLNADGTGAVSLLVPAPPATSDLATGTVKIVGNQIYADIAGSFLPTQGSDKTAYTWNLWPRDGSVTGFAGISDFAPDNTNAAVQVVPLPTALWLFSSALGFIILNRKRITGKASC
ncbi:MAG: hypothetical protein PHC94_12560 [Methylobacter sp.]|nr:hypothetical protein [Methylococcales bacterium]MDD5114841.1 hypothetical protein [Methylobacter sp.]